MHRSVSASDRQRRSAHEAPGSALRLSKAIQRLHETRLRIPRVRLHLVHRDRLSAQLDAGMHARLTLLCAPAGYGKTTVLVDWIRSRVRKSQSPPAVAWLSLEANENDPIQFSRSLLAALHFACHGLDEAVRTMEKRPLLPPLHTVMGVVIGALVDYPREVILALDDYHIVRDSAIHDAIRLLLQHLPSQLHVVIATREDPPFPLVSLRAGGTLCELRATDLRFTPEETLAFLHEVMALRVSDSAAAALEARTEGWIAGIQLAALSMPADGASPDILDFGERSPHDIIDYLGTEVLTRQSSAVQHFLLHTSVVDQMSGSLCEALLGVEHVPGGAQAMLEEIDRANLFVVPLDRERRWYRYHHLFGAFLRLRLERAAPRSVTDLHGRASGWYEEHGLIEQAISHALAGGDALRAVRLVKAHHMSFLDRLHTILGWFEALPPEVVRSSPLLCTIQAQALFGTNRLDAAERVLQVAVEHVRRDPPSSDAAMVEGRIALLRARMISLTGDFERSLALASEALDLLPASDVPGRAMASVCTARVSRMSGDVTPAREHAVAAVIEETRAAGLPVATRMGFILLADIHVLQGRLLRAAAVFVEATRELGPHVTADAPLFCFVQGDLHREWNDLEVAERWLTRGKEAISESIVIEAYQATKGYIALARLRQAQGDGRGATAELEALTGLARRRGFAEPVLARVAAARAHLWLMQGNVAGAIHWANSSGLRAEGYASYWQELEYLVLARVLTAARQPAVFALLDRILEDAAAHGRTGSVIEVLVLRALAAQAFRDPVGALAVLERALLLGEPEGYVRVFADEGDPIASLLHSARVRGVAPDYCSRLLNVLQGRLPVRGGRGAPRSSGSTARALVEPLTERERDILRLLVTGASNQEIAKKLWVATGTVKWYVHQILGKLGVRNRTEAVAKANSLTLV